MPSTVTAFSVKIASLGDTATESVIVRDVMGQWNARNTLGQKRILLPLDGEDAAPTDMLIAFYCGEAGTPLDHGAGGSEAEIEKHLACKRPALIYFSDARADLIGIPGQPGRALEDFKKRYAGAVIDSYADEKELRAKFARQLDATIASHDHFKVVCSSSSSSKGAAAAGAATAAAPITKPLSSCAQTILAEACDDFEAYIGRTRAGGTLRIQANGRQLVEPNDPCNVAKWDAAFEELLAGQYIRDAGCNGQLFQISTKGFDFLKTIGKTPVGYIAELGGM